LNMLDNPIDSTLLKQRSLNFERDRIVDQYLTLVETLLQTRPDADSSRP
jgi:hypothetical protein